MQKNLKVISWNCKRAHSQSPLWKYFSKISPDIALLQEVGSISSESFSDYSIFEINPVTKNNSLQKFKTAILVKGKIEKEISLKTDNEWVNKELERFKGNLVSKKIITDEGLKINVVCVYSPAWPISKERWKDVDVSNIRLKLNKNIWVADLLRYSFNFLKPKSSELWIVGGDFNLSETFDFWSNTPRGNKEFLDEIKKLGLYECLRSYNKKLVPTFKNIKGGDITAQIDHLFVTKALKEKLIDCTTGDREEVFGKNLSDHLPIIATFQM